MIQLNVGAAMLRLLPHAGGRVSVLRLARPSGGVIEVLHPYPEDFFDPVHWAKGGIYPLMPYSNRIANATLMVAGKSIALPAHPDAAPHSLHGNAQAQAWRVQAQSESSAVLTLDSPPSAAWPWRYAGRIACTLMPNELRMHIELRNLDARPMPGGIGLHPYFRHRSDARLGYLASTLWPTTPEFLPLAPRAPQSDETYAPPRALPEGELTQHLSGWDGRFDLDLPDGDGAGSWIPGQAGNDKSKAGHDQCQAGPDRVRLRIQADSVFSHLVVHRPPSQAYLCVEPVSHVADGFNLAARGVAGTGARMLAPGESLGGEVLFILEQA